VELPAAHVCCGRPYYDFGMLTSARRALRRVLDVLDGDAPVVVLEPGCLSVFRKELGQLMPDSMRAKRLAARTRSLAEFLHERDFAPKVEGEVLFHGHCHQKALWGTKADLALLSGASAPDTGCCGMSGSFGYREPFYEASRRIAGMELLPGARALAQRARGRRRLFLPRADRGPVGTADAAPRRASQRIASLSSS
jgi:Fe-S oxidoreductase